jgi:hypothetical protein
MEALLFLTLVVPLLLLFYGAFLLFIHPMKSILLMSLLGGLILGALNIFVDIVAYSAHWWQYEFVQTGLDKPTAFQAFLANAFLNTLNTIHVPLPFYLTPILIYGSLVYLLIWRFWFGKGRWFSILLLVGVPIFCIVRDVLGGIQHTSYQVWENVPLATTATIVFWLIAFYLGFWLFWRKASQIQFVPPVGEEKALRRDVLKQHELQHGPSTSQ